MGIQLIMADVKVATEAMCPSTCNDHSGTTKTVQTLRLSPFILREGQLSLVHGVNDDAQDALCSQTLEPSHVPIYQSIMILASQVCTPIFSASALFLRSASAFVQERGTPETQLTL